MEISPYLLYSALRLLSAILIDFHNEVKKWRVHGMYTTFW